MAGKQMLIDATHPEETRVTIIDGNQLDEYDIEVASRKQLKGNIYLAKVTRVEPSLQAAFVDYGGNRHGFLAYSEIHPDYYQIPVADREALIAEQRAHLASEDGVDDDAVADGAVVDDDDEIELPRPRPVSRGYKIQEVVKRRQIMLIQVVKEERGNKGAALTTYLSLAGRYCVLMPNTSRGGGISRKITNVTDRKRLKKILSELQVPEGMAVIVRTAGSGRNKAEIKRDYEYLIRLWSNIRELTLSSIAPALVYEEGNLIKRSIRDLYERNIEEILVQGDAEYKTSKEFMKLFIPSHAKRVKHYQDPEVPLFQKYKIEEQLDAMHYPRVTLKSGGYLIIQPTEALVSIDVNSGRSTRERHIEETALKTNLEAADEIARQLRLRDLAGLIVVDFIDMMNSRYQTQVERRLKDATKSDRARIQIGRISPFGLMEMSRQRLRPSLLETAFSVCPHCAGTGAMRTIESLALSVLRRIEQEGTTDQSADLEVTVPTPVAMYLLNAKRRRLHSIEESHGVSISISGDDDLLGSNFHVERIKSVVDATVEPAAAEEETRPGADAAETETAGSEGDDGSKRRRRRPRRRKRSDDERDASTDQAVVADDGEASEGEEGAKSASEDAEEGDGATDGTRKRRRRGKRGGRRRQKVDAGGETEIADDSEEGQGESSVSDDDSPDADSPEIDGDSESTDVQLSAEYDSPGLESASVETEIAEPNDDAPHMEDAISTEEDKEVGDVVQADGANSDDASKGAEDSETHPDSSSEHPEEPELLDVSETGEPGEPTSVSAEHQSDVSVPDGDGTSPDEEKSSAGDLAQSEIRFEESPLVEARASESTRENDAPEAADNGGHDGEPVDDEKILEARRTEIIDVDEDQHEEPRRGWWQRLVK
jgi:ribonuclease E